MVDFELGVHLYRFDELRTSVCGVPDQSEGGGSVRLEERENVINRGWILQRCKIDRHPS